MGRTGPTTVAKGLKGIRFSQGYRTGYIICPAPVKESLHVTINPGQPASQSQGNRDGGQRKDRLLGGEIGRRGPSEPSDGVSGGCQ